MHADSHIDHDVTLVTQYYWPEPIGTAFYTADLAAAIDAHPGWSVSVLTGEPFYPSFVKDPRYGARVRQETVGDIRVDRLWTFVPSPGSLSSRLLNELNFVFQSVMALLRRRVHRHPFVVSFAPGIGAVIVGNLLRRRGGRHLSIVHDVSSGLAAGTGLARKGRTQALLRRIEAAALSRSDVVTALSPQMADALRSIGVKSQIEVIPLWARDLFPHAPIPLPNGAPIVLYSGALGRKHGLHRLLILAEQLQRSAPEALLRVQGDGPLLAELSEEIDSREIGNVEFRPLVAEAELPASLAAGRVHVVPQEPDSAAFAVPSKVFSSLAAGRPLVAPARPGSPLHDLSLRCVAVTCVDPDDAEAFHRAVLDRLTDDELYSREAQAALKYVRAHHERRALINELLALLVDSPSGRAAS